MPRLGAMSNDLCINACTHAVLRLFFVGAISEANAVIVMLYAGSKLPPKSNGLRTTQ